MNYEHPRVEPLEKRIVPATTYSTFGLAGINGLNGFTITGGGETGIDVEVSSIANAGDVNGDGLNDLLVGIEFTGRITAGPMDKGRVALIFGKAGGYPTNINLDSLGSDGVIFNGQQDFDHLGTAVSAAGDVNADGLDDFIISAQGNDAGSSGSEVGAAYVIFGRTTWPTTVALASLNGTTGFKIVGDNTRTGTDGIGEVVGGFNLVGAGKSGDFNGDGIDDVIVGSTQYKLFGGLEGGAAFVIFGKNTATSGAFTTPFAVSALDGTNGLAIGSSTQNDHMAVRTGFVGDVNQDGLTDISISNSVETQANRRTFVIFGKGTGNPATIDVNSLTTAQGFELPEFTNESFIGPLEYGSEVTMRDIDDDGDLDLGVSITTFDFATLDTYQGYTFVKNKGTGYTTNPFGLAKNEVRQVLFGLGNVGVDAERVDIGDFNGDGRYDLIAYQTNISDDVAPAVYYGTTPTGRYQIDNTKNSSGVYFGGFGVVGGNGSFDPIPNFLGDINGDGIDDIALRPPPATFAGNVFIVFGSAINPSADGKTVTYRDVDGDTVTVRTTKGAFTRQMFTMTHPEGAVDRGQMLTLLDLAAGANDQDFSGANITISVKKGKTGDGYADVGAINATGIDLGNVTIRGDLGSIDAGDGDFVKPGLNKLDVYRFGRAAGGPAVPSSDIVGRIGSLVVRDEFDNATINVNGAATEGIGSISVTKNFLGTLNLTGPLGSLKAVDLLTGSIIDVNGTSTAKTSITARDIGNGVSIDLATTLGKLSAKQVGTATINAARIDTISVTGDTKAGLVGSFAGTVSAAGGVGSMSVKENFSGDLTLAGPLGAFKAFDMVAGSSIDVNGTSTAKTTITVHNVVDGVTIDLATTLGKLTAAQVGNVTINALRIDSLAVNGDTKTGLVGSFAGTVTAANGVGSMSVKEDFSGDLVLAGPLGSFKAYDFVTGASIDVNGTSTSKTTIAAHSIVDGVIIDLATTLGKLTAAQIGSATLTAARIDTLSVTGDTRTSLAGSLAATIRAAGGVGTVSVKENFSGNLDLTSGPLNSFKAYDLTSSATIKALGVNTTKTGITAHVINDSATINIANTISKLTAARIGNATITADRIDSLSVNGDSRNAIPGDLTANITLDNAGVTDGKIKALGTVKIAGTFHDATISATGSVGSFSAAAMQNARLFAGYTPTMPATPLTGGTFPVADTLIGTFTITGKATLTTAVGSMDDSFVVAANLGTVSLPTVDTTTGTATWGFAYRDTIKKLTAKTPAFTYNLTTGGTQSTDDFTVVKLP